MKICPRCREEYLDTIISCSPCQEELVREQDVHISAKTGLLSKEELLSHETVALLEGSLDSCRELEKTLTKAKISSAVYPKTLSCDDNAATLGASCSLKYMLLVRVDDVQACQEALHGSFTEQIAREGKGKFIADTINLEDTEIQCPACGHQAALNQGECVSCGLFLGEVG